MTVHTDIPERTTLNGNSEVNFPRGAKRTHRIDVVDSAGSPQSMSGWSLAYVWRDATGSPVVSKTSGSGISTGNGAGTSDRATVTIDAADTASLIGQKYSWALWRTDSTNDDVLAEGTLVLSSVAAQP